MTTSRPLPLQLVVLGILLLCALPLTARGDSGRAPAPEAMPAPRIFVRQVRITGNTVLPEQTIAEITAPFTQHFVDATDLETLRYRLTEAYVSRGYVNSGVVLPNQTVQDGIVTYQVIEGRLTGIDVTGTKALSPSMSAAGCSAASPRR